MIPGIAPVIVQQSAGGLVDGFEDDFSTDTTAGYSGRIRYDDAADPATGVIGYNPGLPGLTFTQAIAWAGVTTPSFDVQPGAQYLVETVHDNYGPAGQGEVYVTAGAGGPLIAILTPRGAANKTDIPISGLVTAAGPVMAVYLQIRAGGSSSLAWRLCRVTRA